MSLERMEDPPWRCRLEEQGQVGNEQERDDHEDEDEAVVPTDDRISDMDEGSEPAEQVEDELEGENEGMKEAAGEFTDELTDDGGSDAMLSDEEIDAMEEAIEEREDESNK